MRRAAHLLVGLILAGLAAGCNSGEPLGVGISGTVTYKGELIREGMITFIPLSGTNGPTAGASVDDGKYAIPRRGALAPGKYRVEIKAFEETGKEVTKSTHKSQMFGRPVEVVSSDPAVADVLAKAKMERKNYIPKRYNETSELAQELPDESQVTINFDL
jgi:hypothetical protein